MTSRIAYFKKFAFSILNQLRLFTLMPSCKAGSAQLLGFAFLAFLTTAASSPQSPAASISPLPGSFRVYIPIAMHQEPLGKYGIAPGGYDCGDFNILPPQWFYFWGNNQPCGTSFADPRFVDMIWGRDNITESIHSNIILGFNEPNLCGQSNLSPLEAASLWHQIEQMYPDKYLVSPVPAQTVQTACSNGPKGTAWLWAMVDEYMQLFGHKPRFDAIAVHYYWSDNSFASYLTQLHGDNIQHGYNVPVWITEFGTCGPNEVQHLENALDFIQSNSWIEHAGWYKIRTDVYDPNPCSTLLDTSNNLTDLGKVYADYLKRLPLN